MDNPPVQTHLPLPTTRTNNPATKKLYLRSQPETSLSITICALLFCMTHLAGREMTNLR
jgi:hypothetical protein